ncbi:MAG: aminotransferase class I/II-fold pyridoxal phosphate-dependent enzyme [Candidatus Coproplasma sp.]
MYNYEILTQLNKFKGKDKIRLHVPGHKNLSDFRANFPIAPIDFTELDFSDDLNCPTGVIKKAQEDIAEILGAKKAYITTDGSSSGVMVMLFCAQAFGNKIIVPRNSHKSVFNACRILNIEPVIVQGEEVNGILMPPSPELVETLIVNDVNISGMIIASPDYYGNVAPLGEYAQILRKYSRLLFVDGAHGAHLALNEGRKFHASLYADIWTDGAHKCLPTLTQGSIVCVNNDKLITRAEEGLSIFRTSSPSYPIMASVEYGVKYFVNNPKQLAKAKGIIEELKVGLKGIPIYQTPDWSKLIIDFLALGISPYIVQGLLEKKGIYLEMNDGRYLLFYLSGSMDGYSAMELKNALISICAQKRLYGTYVNLPKIPKAERTYSFLYAYKQKYEWVPLDGAIGKMSADNAGISPPSLPVLVAGEMVTKEAVACLSTAKSTFGVQDGMIKVVKK